MTFQHTKRNLISTYIDEWWSLREAPCVHRLFGLESIQTSRWATDVEKMVSSIYWSRKFLTPTTFLYLSKSAIRRNIVLLAYIDRRCLDRAKKRICLLMGDELCSTVSHRWKGSSYSLLHWMCLDELHSSFPPVLTITSKTRYVTL